MNITTLTGIAASICTAVSLIPQLVQIIRSRKAKDVSYGMLGVLLAGLALWVCYGLLKKDWIIVVSNSFSVLINILTIGFSIKYKKR